MKFRNFRFNTDILPFVLGGAIILTTTGTSAAYYLYESKHQICEDYSNVDDNDIFIDEDGNYCKTFDVGKHVIKISRNDSYFHDYNEIDGYTIKKVEIIGWRHNSKAIYVNTEPVTAIGKRNINGNLVFNDFGIVQEKKKIK